MDAFDVLTRQHRDVEALFGRLAIARGGEWIALVGQLAEALTVHGTVEERFLYPVARQHGLDRVTDDAETAHDEIRRRVAEILETRQRAPELPRLVAALEKTVRAHVVEEEERLFPALRAEASLLTGQAEALLEAARELQQEPLFEAAENEGELTQA